MGNTIAVLTGDIIDSRRIRETEQLSATLDDILAQLNTRFDGRAERFRGDAFQLALGRPEHALSAALLLRTALIQRSTREQRWDARIAIAIGPGAPWQHGKRIAEATAPPFVASGLALDAMEDGSQHLSLTLTESDESGCLTLLIRYVDTLVEAWSPQAAEAVHLSLCHAESQQALARRLGISQPAVHKRLRIAHWPLLQETLAYLQQRLIDEKKRT